MKIKNEWFTAVDDTSLVVINKSHLQLKQYSELKDTLELKISKANRLIEGIKTQNINLFEKISKLEETSKLDQITIDYKNQNIENLTKSVKKQKRNNTFLKILVGVLGSTSLYFASQ